MRRAVVLGLLLAACGSDPKITLDFEALPVAVSMALRPECTLVSSGSAVELAPFICADVAAGDQRLEFEVIYDEDEIEPTTCRFDLTVTTDCGQTSPVLLLGRFEARLFEGGRTTPRLTLDATGFNSRFDEDDDGYTNYVEHLNGSDPRSPSSTPRR